MRARIVFHRQRKCELHPVRRTLHLLQFLLPRQKSAIEPGFHMQHVANGDAALLLIWIRRALFREKRKQWLVELHDPRAHSHAGKRRRNRLRHRSQVMRRLPVIRIKARIRHHIAMPDHQQTMDSERLLANLMDRIRQRSRIESLRFRCRRPPLLVRIISLTARGRQQRGHKNRRSTKRPKWHRAILIESKRVGRIHV